MHFAGKSILITGAARGMGAEHVRQLVAQGARVIFSDVLEVEGAALAAELGENAHFVRHDVADEDAWIATMAEVERFAGGLDGLVNNAAIIRFGPLTEVPVADFVLHQRVNELGVFLGMKHAAPLMRARGGGSIVNVSSLASMRVAGNDAAYVSSKWAVRGMTKSAAKELGPSGIRVNSIHPGMVETAMLDEPWDEVRSERLRRVPLGRPGTKAEMSAVVLFLLSARSSYVTGADIVIDGGLGL